LGSCHLTTKFSKENLVEFEAWANAPPKTMQGGWLPGSERKRLGHYPGLSTSKNRMAIVEVLSLSESLVSFFAVTGEKDGHNDRHHSSWGWRPPWPWPLKRGAFGLKIWLTYISFGLLIFHLAYLYFIWLKQIWLKQIWLKQIWLEKIWLTYISFGLLIFHLAYLYIIWLKDIARTSRLAIDR
jgi:hypothetical protein